jgi:hypothetical protein
VTEEADWTLINGVFAKSEYDKYREACEARGILPNSPWAWANALGYSEIPEYAGKNPSNSVDHPKHYNSGKFEVIDIIEDQNLGFCLGNAIKYILRAGKKDESKTKEDLEKAIWYINRYIGSLK